MKQRFGLFVVVLLLALSQGVHGQAQDAGVMPWPTDGWGSSTPEQQGLDSALLEKLFAANLDAHTILAIRHGSVVLDTSQYPFSSADPHALYSVTKSVVSILAGIAIDKGYIQGVDQSIFDFFDKAQTANMDARKEAITVGNLLTHTTGLSLQNDMNVYKLTADDPAWVQFILDEPMVTQPGTAYQYGDANAHLVSAILSKATGMSAADFAKQVLFGPLGITEFTWVADPQGVSRGGDHLYLSPADLAKLGYLYLRQGEWDGQQVVSADWVSRSTSNLVKGHYWDGYGYFWYNGVVRGTQQPGFSAVGTLGQAIWVMPDADLVVVTTNDSSVINSNQDMPVARTIANAIVADGALPDNPEAVAALQTRLDARAHPQPGNLSKIPDTVKAVSGQVFTLGANPLGWTSVAFDFTKADEALITVGRPEGELALPVGLDNVYRLATGGLPPDPVWRPVDDVPLALKGGALGNKLMITMADHMGMDSWMVTVTFSKDNSKLWIDLTSTAQSSSDIPVMMTLEGAS